MSADGRLGPRGTFMPPLRSNRWVMLWFLANGVSQIGNRVYTLAIPWLVMSMTGSAWYMNAVWAAEMLPFVLVGPFMGALVDRLDRRKVMLVSELAQACLVGLIPLLSFLGHLQVWHLFVIGFLLNCFAIAYNLVGDFGVVPRLVSGANLATANAIHFTILNLSAVFGTAIGGALIAWLGAPGAILLNALSFLATLFVVAVLPIQFGSRVEPLQKMVVHNVWRDVREGFAFVWKDGLIRNLALGLSLGNLATGALFVILTYHLGQEWQLPPEQVGLGFSVMGGAAVVGSMVAPFFIRRFPIGRSVGVWGIMHSMGILVAAVSGHWILALAGLGMGGLVATISNISTFTIRQKRIPNELMGRVNSAFRMILTLSFPLSAMLLGEITTQSGARTAFGLSAAITAVAALLLLLSPVGRYHLPKTEE